MPNYLATTLSRILPVLGAAFLLATPSLSHGHAVITSPPSRDPNTSIKDPGPCGPLPRGTPTAYKTGQTVNVTWDETVYHPGCYLVDVSPANDQNWQPLLTLTHAASTVAPIPYMAQVKLPQGLTCPSCTLRVRQLMLNTQQDPCPPSMITAGQTYYSCADITISDTVGAADMAQTTPPDLASTSPDGGSGGPAATGCQALPTSATASPLAGLALLALAALTLRRRLPT